MSSFGCAIRHIVEEKVSDLKSAAYFDIDTELHLALVKYNEQNHSDIFKQIHNTLSVDKRNKIFVMIDPDEYTSDLEIELFKAGVFDVCLYYVDGSRNDVLVERILKAF